MSGAKDEPGFANRWSRLKQEAKEQPEDAAPVAEPAPETETADDRTDEEVLEELGLPNPETLKPGDNFAAFMAKAVPARLRNRALRKLWISDPVLANLDELIDYGEDFTDAATVVENLQTAYQVGKGWVERAAELPEEKTAAAGEKTGDPDAPAEEQADESVSEPGGSGKEDIGPAADRTGEFHAEPATPSAPEPQAFVSIPEPKRPPRQRMRFRMAED